MLTYLKWTVRVVLILLATGFLHYTLPQHDIVRVTNTYNRMTSVSGANSWAYASPDAGTTNAAGARDVRFIETVFPDDTVMVYRNEDTGWIWPPYFKYDSSNLQAKASDLKSTKAAPVWVSITHYGWRLPILSIFPNAVGVREVAGPDVRIIPYLNIVLLILLGLGAFMIRRMWLQFIERMVEPAVAEVQETWDGVSSKADTAGKGAKGFFARLWAKRK